MSNQHQTIMILHDDNEENQDQVDDFPLKRNTVKDVVVASSSSSSSSSCSSVTVSNGGGAHSNGGSTAVKDIDGSSLQKEEEVEEKGNVGDYNNDFDDDDEEEDCVAVAEFVGEEPTNGEAITDDTFSADNIVQNSNSVYFDKEQGDEVSGLNRDENGDTKNHEESKFYVQVENSAIQSSLRSELNKFPNGSELSALCNSSDEQATPAVNFHEETEKESNSKNEIDQQEKEFDVELVIAKQETHDLFCPNCKSCITKRVILKKRKRNIHVLDNKGKRDRLESIVENNVVSSSTAREVDQGVTSEITNLDPPPAASAAADRDHDDDDHPEKEVEGFRCLSCFSIFIPSGKGFNLFRNFGGSGKHETLQNPASSLQNSSNIQVSNPNWFISLFTYKRKTSTEQAGDTSHEPSRTGPAEQNQSTVTSTILSSSEISHPEGPLAVAAPINAKPVSGVIHGHETMNSTISSNGEQSVVQDFIDFSEKEQSLTRKPRTDDRERKQSSVDTTKTNTVEVTSSMNYSNGTVSEYKSVNSVTTTSTETIVSSRETTKGTVLNHYQEKPKFPVPTSVTVGSLVIEDTPKDVNKMPETVKNIDSSLWQSGAQPPVQSFDSTSSAIDALFPLKTDISLLNKVRQDIDNFRKENQGDVIVDVDGGEANEITTLQTEDNVPVDGAIATEPQTQVGIREQRRDEIVEPKKWEIVKSIVYGGLVESITSLGIVSSAVSSGVTPLNIIALGFANLIGGLFILAHNLKDLKDSHARGEQVQSNARDRYQELLGQRSNFVFHAVIAVFSFLIFGSVPLIIYGVLINKSYYDEVKLAIVAASSVACIILLTIGKVYTQRPPKSYFKTVLYYVSMALAASGLSFIAGKLIKDVIDKFSKSESGFAIAMPISDTKTAWMSY
ncbi:membrane protein of ER body-like protein isoform X3 [Lathyrus oleraceus]|nr:membrane protein of ER body-like protein isoform X3 [Pisum sativum]